MNRRILLAVAGLSPHLETSRLKISLAHKTLYCGSRQMPVRLPKQLFAWY
jgi:hypothetical protein